MKIIAAQIDASRAAGFIPGQLSQFAEAIGKTDRCPRCGGSGNHGPLQVEAGKCFKCGGNGRLPVRFTKAEMVQVAKGFDIAMRWAGRRSKKAVQA